MRNKTNKLDALNELFRMAVNANTDNRQERINSEEFYFNDVEGTKSQFNKKQKANIERTYNIPISTKMTYSVIENLLSFYTAAKPMPRYVATTDELQEQAMIYEKIFHSIWYESYGYTTVTKWIRDSLITGDGYLLVRPSDYYNETTANVVMEYIPWKRVFIDPECRQVAGFKDAEYVIILDVMRRKKAERVYDIKIPLDDAITDNQYDLFNVVDDFKTSSSNLFSEMNEDRYVAIKDFYINEIVNVYIGSDEEQGITGVISNKKPKERTIPNEEKEALKQKLLAMSQSSMDELGVQEQLQQENQEIQDKGMSPISEYVNDSESKYANDTMLEESESQDNQGMNDLMALQEQLNSMPDTITVYDIETIDTTLQVLDKINNVNNKKTVTVKEVIRQKIPRIRNILVVGSKIIKDEILPIDVLPLINLPFVENNSPNDIYGIIHFIKDLVKGQNKYLSQMQLDMAINAHRKVFVWESTVVEPIQMEERYAQPGAFIMLKPDPTLPNGGMPTFVEHSPMNQSFQMVLEYFKQLIEYITGVFGIIQGDPTNAPNSYGGMQNIQTFGMQRVKLFSRQMEQAFERLGYVVAQYINAYTPRDMVITYLDDNKDQQEVKLLDDNTDIKFKVRVDITSALPTQRQMVAQQLAFVAQTFGDDSLKSLMLQYMLKIQDVPEANDMAKQMDIVKQMQQQLQQAQQQIEELTKQQKVADNQMLQKDTAAKVNEIGSQAQLQAQDQLHQQEMKQLTAGQETPEQPVNQEEQEQDLPF